MKLLSLSILLRATFMTAAALLSLTVAAQTNASPGARTYSAAEIAVAPPRTWEELKTEVQTRADRQRYPLTGMRSDDVRPILARIHSLDNDEWGRSWAQAGRDYMEKGRQLEATDRKAASSSPLSVTVRAFSASGRSSVIVAIESATS